MEITQEELFKIVDKREEEIRKEFAKAFGWYELKQSYGYSLNSEKEYKIPTWPEIFIKLGKILANQKENKDNLLP